MMQNGGSAGIKRSSPEFADSALGPPQEVPELELRGVTKRFGTVTAVDSVSLAIRRGEFFSLLGPSGCGKSTTLRMIAGFVEPTAGEILLRGAIVNDVPPYRRHTNMVFQHLALFPHMNVGSNIAFGLRMKRLPRPEIDRRVLEALRLVELSGFEHRAVSQLSGGQQQRVAIARALINEPAVLLLDEPLGALDLKLRLQMQAELRALQDRVNCTFVYVTHDQGEALMMSHRIAIMNRGVIEQIGTSEEIYFRPRTEFVATFIGDTNLLHGRVERQGSERVLLRGDRIDVVLSKDVPESAFGRARSLSLRFERLLLGDAAEPCVNRFRGKLTDLIFLGATIRYVVRVNDTLKLTAQVANLAWPSSRVGDDIIVGWQPDDAILLESPSGAQPHGI